MPREIACRLRTIDWWKTSRARGLLMKPASGTYGQLDEHLVAPNARHLPSMRIELSVDGKTGARSLRTFADSNGWGA